MPHAEPGSRKSQEQRKCDVKNELEQIGFDVVVEVIVDRLRECGQNTEGLRELGIHDEYLPTNPRRGAKWVDEFIRMLRLARRDEAEQDREYHLSRAVEIGEQIGYMSKATLSDEIELYCRGWRLLVRGYKDDARVHETGKD